MDKFPSSGLTAKIFLAGSIEMGIAEDWQTQTEIELESYPVTLYNPRRSSWDSSWIQRESNEQFNKQVNWEMDKLEQSDIIFFRILGDTKSPITLMELGLHANDNVIVCCDEEFWRFGNIEIVCSRFNIPLFTNYEKAIASLKSKIHTIANVI
jgi:hypothetical protein